MKVALEKAEAIVASGRELYRRLSRTQRVALFLVSGLLLASLVFLAVSDTESGSVVSTKDGGLTQRTDVAARPVDGPVPERSSGFWGIEPPEERKARERAVNLHKLEQALCGEKVIDATVVPYDAPRRSFVTDKSSGDSAAVKLTLREGVESLQRQEADALREMVCCALGLPPEKLSMVDNHGKAYAAGGALAGEARLYEDEEYHRKCIRFLITEYYSKFFKPTDFYVAVVVYLSAEQTTIEKEEYNREKSFALNRVEDSERVEERTDHGPPGGIGARHG